MRIRTLFKLAVIGGFVGLLWSKPWAKTVAAPKVKRVPPIDIDGGDQYDALPRDEKLESGELYGMHIDGAQDAEIVDQDVAMDEGQNWLEALETNAVENGPMPGKRLDMREEETGRHRLGERHDLPVADRGSGGPAGL